MSLFSQFGRDREEVRSPPGQTLDDENPDQPSSSDDDFLTTFWDNDVETNPELEIHQCKRKLIEVIRSHEELLKSKNQGTQMNKDILEKLIAELKVVLESLGKLLTNPNNYERKFSDAIRSGIFFSYSTLNCLSVEYHSLYRNQLLIFKLFLLFLMKCFTTNSEVDPELLNDEKIVEYSFIFNYLFSHFDHVDFSLMLQNETTTLRSLLKTYFNVVSVKKELASGWFSLMWIESFDISNESLNSSILKSRIRKLFDDARFPSYDILKFYFQHTTDHEIMVNLKTLINFDEEDNTLLRRWFMSDYCSLFDDLANITERYSPHNSIEENLKYPINCLTYILCNCFEALGFKLTSQLEGWLMNNLNEGIFNMSMVVRIIYKLSTYSGSSKYILGLLSNLQICSCLLLNINIKEDEFCSILIFWNMVQDDPHLATSIFAEEIRDYDFETDTNELRVMAHLLFENDQEVLAMELSSLFEEYIESDIDYELKKDSIPVKILLTTLLKFFTNDPELNQFMIKLNRILLTRIKMWSSELYRSIIYYLREINVFYHRVPPHYIEEMITGNDVSDDVRSIFVLTPPSDSILHDLDQFWENEVFNYSQMQENFDLFKTLGTDVYTYTRTYNARNMINRR